MAAAVAALQETQGRGRHCRGTCGNVERRLGCTLLHDIVTGEVEGRPRQTGEKTRARGGEVCFGQALEVGARERQETMKRLLCPQQEMENVELRFDLEGGLRRRHCGYEVLRRDESWHQMASHARRERPLMAPTTCIATLLGQAPYRPKVTGWRLKG